MKKSKIKVIERWVAIDPGDNYVGIFESQPTLKLDRDGNMTWGQDVDSENMETFRLSYGFAPKPGECIKMTILTEKM